MYIYKDFDIKKECVRPMHSTDRTSKEKRLAHWADVIIGLLSQKHQILYNRLYSIFSLAAFILLKMIVFEAGEMYQFGFTYI